MVTQAIILAAAKHDGQTRNEGTPYIYHPLRVAEILKTAGYDEKYQTVAILHDLLEDTDATEEEIAEFGDDVLEAVKLLTRRPGMDENEYVNRILENPLAATVKSVDKIHNLWDCLYSGPSGSRRSEEAKRFGKRYVSKAHKYYEGKFNQALDDAIARADNDLCYREIRDWKPIIVNGEQLELYDYIASSKVAM